MVQEVHGERDILDLAAGPRSGLVQSVDRAMRLLFALVEAGRPQSGPDLADRCGINRSTAWRLLATLEHYGLVGQDLQHNYQLGHGAITLAGAAFQRGALQRRLRPQLEELSAKVRETVNLSIATAGAMVCVDQIDGPHLVSINWLGLRQPLHCSSNGKVLLSFMSERELDSVFRQPLERFTVHTITDETALRREVEQVRADGFALALGEYEEGFNGISAAVVDPLGQPVAFVSVSGPAHRASPERLRSIASDLVACAHQMTHELRARP